MNFFDWKGEEIKGNSSTTLIGERFGLKLTTVDGPTVTTSTDSEQSSAIPQLKGQRRFQGEGEGSVLGCAREARGPFIGLEGEAAMVSTVRRPGRCPERTQRFLDKH